MHRRTLVCRCKQSRRAQCHTSVAYGTRAGRVTNYPPLTRGDARIGVRARCGRIAVLINIAPYETSAALGQAIHQREIVGEIRHARIVDFVAQATDVQLRKMMIGWLLQGPAPSLTNVMNSRRLMFPQGNDGTLSRNDGWLVALHCKIWRSTSAQGLGRGNAAGGFPPDKTGYCIRARPGMEIKAKCWYVPGQDDIPGRSLLTRIGGSTPRQPSATSARLPTTLFIGHGLVRIERALLGSLGPQLTDCLAAAQKTSP